MCGETQDSDFKNNPKQILYSYYTLSLLGIHNFEHGRCLEWIGGKFDPAKFNAKQIKFSSPDARLNRINENK